MNVFKFLAFCAISCGVIAAGANAQIAEPTIITNVALIDGLGNAPVAAQDIVIEGGKITAIGATGTVKAPDGAAKIDGAGLTAMPGLIDMHTHLLGGWANGTVPGDEFLPNYDPQKVRRTLPERVDALWSPTICTKEAVWSPMNIKTPKRY